MKFTRRDAVILLLSSLLVGVFTDILFRQSIFGANFFIWSVLWVVILGIIGFLKNRLTLRFIVFGLIILVNSFTVYLRAEAVVQFWSVIIVLVSLLLMTGMLYAENFMELTIVNRATEYLTGVVNTIFKGFQAILAASDNKQQKVKKPKRVSLGIFIAIFLGLIFIALFSGSDAVFKHQFSFIGTFFSSIGNWLGHYNIGRIITITFWLLFSLAALLAMRGRDKPVKARPLHMRKFLAKNDPTIILATLCAIFGVFIIIQIRYLFAGGQLPADLTYADYARRGYGELLLATMLASGVIYGSIAWTKDAVRSTARTILANLLVILNGIVVLSAWKRLSLYESAYGWTMTRFIARLGLICIMLGSILLLLWVNHVITTRRLFGFNWYMIAAVLTIAAALNPIGIVTQKNLTERTQRTQSIDTNYILKLSADSYPALCKYAGNLQQTYPDEYKQLQLNKKGEIKEPLPGMTEPQVIGTVYPSRTNHGLSAHYTLSANFKQKYYGCLQQPL